LPLLHTHVSFKGDVERKNREYQFGSLRDHGLLEIWERPEYVDFRADRGHILKRYSAYLNITA
jgi:hypothetical protein